MSPEILASVLAQVCSMVQNSSDLSLPSYAVSLMLSSSVYFKSRYATMFKEVLELGDETFNIALYP